MTTSLDASSKALFVLQNRKRKKKTISSLETYIHTYTSSSRLLFLFRHVSFSFIPTTTSTTSSFSSFSATAIDGIDDVDELERRG